MERGIVIGQGLRFLRAELPGILAAARGGALSPRMLRLVEDLARRPLWRDRGIRSAMGSRHRF